MTRVRRFDAQTLGQAERLPTGGLRIPATLARTGVLEYPTDQGVRREYRSPEEVFKASALAGARGAPVTRLHPPQGRVDSADWRRLAVGHVGEDVRQDTDGRHVAASVYVQDADVIADIEAGHLPQISLGYDVTYIAQPGVSPEGERYDGLQVDILVNHAALVPKGRAGSTVGLRLDADGHQTLPETTEPMKISIAGKEYDAGSPELAKAVKAMEARAARADALETQIKAQRLVSVKAQASAVGVTEFKADADEGSIMAETVAKIAPGVSLEGASSEFVAGAFAVAIAMALGAEEEPVTDEEPEKDPAAAEPLPPAGPSAAAVRQDMLEARRARQAKRATREDANDDSTPSLAEAARLRMIEAGKNLLVR